MEKERLTKKQIIPVVIGVLTLVVLVASATYAYFSVTAGNSSGTTTITGDIGGDTIGTVTLSGGGTNLYLGLSAYDMSESKAGTTYYSSTTQGSRETNVNSAGKATYTATLSGDESDEVMYACDYEFTVTSRGTAIGQESINDIELVFNGDINKTINLTGSDKVSGTWFGFKNSNKEREFNAYLKLTNTEVEQNDLAGKNLSISITNTKWKCYLSELDELVGEAYALLIENGQTDWGDTAYSLTFVRSETPINSGDEYNGVEITNVYTGFEDSNDVPWQKQTLFISNVMFEDEIRPITISHWFSKNFTVAEVLDVTKLNTSLVTDMSYAFYNVGIESSGHSIISIIGLENWDTSNVTNMSSMFLNVILRENELDLSNWDVSNVTDMSYLFAYLSLVNVDGVENWNVSNVTDMSHMFSSAEIPQNFDLSNWDVSNVTDMSWMFANDPAWAFEFNAVGIEKWDVGNVTNMSYMFSCVILSDDFKLDLSGWDVSSVRYYNNFFGELDENYEEISSTKITPPVWKNVYFSVYSADDYSLRIYSNIGTIVIPEEGSKYEGRTATKVYNISAKGSNPVSCNTTIAPTQIIAEDNIVAPSSTSSWFIGCTKVNKIDLSKLDTSNVTYMSYMFANVGSDTSVTSMTIIGIESFNTSKVTDMSSMFYNFGKNATYTLDLSGWDVSKITSTYSYQNFNYGVTSKVIAPSWNTTT